MLSELKFSLENFFVGYAYVTTRKIITYLGYGDGYNVYNYYLNVTMTFKLTA